MGRIRIHNLGEGLGDCFIIELIKNDNIESSENTTEKIVIMVDGHNYRKELSEDAHNDVNSEIKETLVNIKKVDYLVVTHCDADHIAGVIPLINDSTYNAVFANTVIIYNYIIENRVNYCHAQRFEKLIQNRKVVSSAADQKTLNLVEYHRNAKPSDQNLKLLHYDIRRTRVDPAECKNPNIAFLTLLQPNREGILAIQQHFRRHNINYQNSEKIEKKQPDAKMVNRNSIAFLLEYDKKTILFTGDGYFDEIEKRLEALTGFDKKKVDLIKIPHHGAEENNEKLVSFSQIHQCTNFIVTGEKEYKEKHPSGKLLRELLENAATRIYTKIEIDPAKCKIMVQPGQICKNTKIVI